MDIPSLRSEIEILYAWPLRSPRTLEKMLQLFRLLQEFGLERVEDLTPVTIARFAAWLSIDRSTNTVAGLLSYLRSITRYCFFAGYLGRDPFQARRGWVRWERTARPIWHTRDDIARVLKSLSIKQDWLSRRTHAVISLVAHTGIRRSEALHARSEDYVPGQGVLWIRSTAGNRTKTRDSAAAIPIPPDARSTLDRWIFDSKSEWLFPNFRRSGPWIHGANGYRPVDAIRRAGEAAGVANLTFLSLRHTWATQAESAWGFSELLVQRILRHSKSPTQLHYRHADMLNLRESMDRVRF